MRRWEDGLLYGGVAVVALGFVLIGVTWGQVARLDSVAAQVPHLVSGGLVGLGLIIVGATAVNIHGKHREAAEREHQAQQLLAVLRHATERSDVPPSAKPESCDR